MSEQLVLVVEDDRPIRNFICVSLKAHGYKYVETSSGKSAISLAASNFPDAILLDLGLPDMDGLYVIESIRQWSTVPIIIVSARGQEKEKVEALDLGADDYLAKPFGIDELMARIRVAIRNKERLPMNIPSVFEAEGLKIDYVKRRVELDGEEIHLTPIEYRILALLTKYEGKVLTHNFIQREVWGTDLYEPQTLRVFMAGLRRKIEKTPAQPRYITTEVGVGYRFNRE